MREGLFGEFFGGFFGEFFGDGSDLLGDLGALEGLLVRVGIVGSLAAFATFGASDLIAPAIPLLPTWILA